jgi:hypothetical protein
MKTKTIRRKRASIAKTRWTAYAAAGAATALGGSHSAQAAIHYSGLLNERFPGHEDKSYRVSLDQTGDSIYFARREATFSGTDMALFKIYGLVSASFIGYFVDTGSSAYGLYVSKLRFGRNISTGHFTFRDKGILAQGDFRGGFQQWGHPGTGYVGFRFNNGAGIQYGWARVRMAGRPENAFKVSDFAYADPGEPITAGQTQSAPDTPDEGSLGWLAVGALGLLAWRKIRFEDRSLDKATAAG